MMALSAVLARRGRRQWRGKLGSDSFERGGRPRSVPDADGEAYNEMIRRHRQAMASRESAPPSAPRGPVDTIAAGIAHVLNGPREARREVEQGHVVRGLIDGAMATPDLELGSSAANGIWRGSFKLGGSHSWGATRKWLGKAGLAEKGQHMHHALIPNNGWGKKIPDVIKNQPWNLKATESPLHHTRIHGRSLKFGLPQFNALERYWHGTPTWWKAANGSAVVHAGRALADQIPSHDRSVGLAHPSPRR